MLPVCITLPVERLRDLGKKGAAGSDSGTNSLAARVVVGINSKACGDYLPAGTFEVIPPSATEFYSPKSGPGGAGSVFVVTP